MEKNLLYFNSERALEHTKYLVDTIGVREAGQEGEHQAADYIQAQFEALKLENVWL